MPTCEYISSKVFFKKLQSYPLQYEQKMLKQILKRIPKCEYISIKVFF